MGGGNFLCFPETQRSRFLPSSTLESVCLHVKYGENAVLPNPVIEKSSIQDLYRNAFKQIRDQMLPFPGIETPGTADGRAVPMAEDMARHDYFHAMAASEVGSHYRLFLGFYMKFRGLLKESQELRDNGQIRRFIDLLASSTHSYVVHGSKWIPAM